MRIPRLAALAAALVLVADAASGDTLSVRFPQLAVEIQSRLTAFAQPPLTRLEKKQKAACKKALKPMAADTDDLGKTIANERAAVSALEAAFKTDPSMTSQLEFVATAAQFDVSDFAAFVNVRATALPDGSAKKKAMASIAAATKSETAAGVTTKSRASRLALHAKALSALVKADVVVKKALVDVVVDQIDAYADARRLFAATGTASSANAVYVSADAGALRVLGNFQSMGVPHAIQFRVDAPAVGGIAVEISPETFYNDGAVKLPATSGTVQITTWDPADQKVGGTFDIVYSNGTTTVHVTNGVFSFIDMPTQ